MSITSEGRRAQIMTVMKNQGRVSVPALADQMKVSQETIRRDLKLLEEAGSVRRVHGGAVLPSLLIEQPVTERLSLHRVAKDRIAARAVELIQEDMSLFLDPSSSAIALAHALVGFHTLTVVTNSLEVARIVGERSSNRLIVIGGLYKREDAAMFGFDPPVLSARYRYDIVFSGIAAITAGHGLMDYEEEEAQLRRALVPAARRYVILSDKSKFNCMAFIQALTFDEITDLITDEQPPDDIAEALVNAGVAIHLAGRRNRNPEKR